MKKLDADTIACPVKYTIEMLSGKWKMHIIWQLIQQDTIRFNELQRRLTGISTVVLKRMLNELQENKLVNRVQYNEMPPKVEYSLTEYGREMIPIFKSMRTWAAKSYPERFPEGTLNIKRSV